MKRFFCLFLTLCFCFAFCSGCGTFQSSDGEGETNDNIEISFSDGGDLACTKNGGGLQLNVKITGAKDKTVIFIIDEEDNFVEIDETYYMTVAAGVPNGYTFTVTAVSKENKSKYVAKTFTVVIESSSKPSTPSKPSNPSNPDPTPTPTPDQGPTPTPTPDPDIPGVEYLSNGRIKAPTTNLVEDFSGGIDPDKWYISNQAWGWGEEAEANGYEGCITENVSYTADGILLIKANGKYSQNGRMSGASLVTKELYGAGRYSVAMKVMPRLGACNAFWTFYYAEEDGQLPTNHEIDIEFPGHVVGGDNDGSEIGYDRILNTNWLTERNSTSQGTKTLTPANDGKWHLYEFEWHTSPTPRVDYYADGVKVASATTNVPTIKGRIWVGCWFPRDWCGVPDFETDYMMVDWISYEPFEEPTQTIAMDAPRSEQNVNNYPKTPASMPVTDYVSNGTFEGNAAAWALSGASISTAKYAGTKGLTLNAGGSATQKITAVYGGFKYDLSAYLKGNAKIEITFRDRAGGLLPGGTQTFASTSSSAFAKVSGVITAPANSESMTVKILSESGTAYADNVSLKLKTA